MTLANARRLKAFLTSLATLWTVASVPLLAAELTGIDTSAINRNLVPLTENPRYLQYRGLPCVPFWGTHHWGWREHPTADQLRVTASYANFITLQATGHRYSSFASLWERVNDDAPPDSSPGD